MMSELKKMMKIYLLKNDLLGTYSNKKFNNKLDKAEAIAQYNPKLNISKKANTNVASNWI